MAALSTIIAGVGLAIGAAGTVTSVNAANASADASKKAEQLRKRQMELESIRQRRSAIRNSLRARSMSLTNATAQGAAGGSGLQGGYGQIGQQTGENITGVNNAEEIGAGIFNANAASASAGALAAFGSGLSSLGGAIVNNAPTIASVGTYLATPRTTAP